MSLFQITISILSAVSSVILAIVSIVALRSLKIAKKDIYSRSEREAVSLAVSQIEYFRSNILNEISRLTTEEGTKRHKRVLNKFSFEEACEKKIENEIIVRYKENLENRAAFSILNDIVNKLEYFSITFTSGAAKEQVAFHPLGDTFCEFVEKHYEFYCYKRKDGNLRFYKSTIDLYKIWKNRILEAKSEYSKKITDNEIREELNNLGKIEKETITPLGIEK